MNGLVRPGRLISLAVMAELLVGQVLAQEAPTADTGASLEEIVVTAEKRTESIQEVPLSIMAVSGADLQAAGVTSPADLGKLVPALQINNSLFSSGITIRIRGFGSAANTATDSDVASYLDSVFIPRPGAITSSFLDVNSVEVLSGPQGTLFGRNAAMGAISINSNLPSTETRSFDTSIEGGNYTTYRGTAVANVPVNDQFAVRLAVEGSHTNGLFDNELNDRTYGDSNQLVGRLTAKWDISPDVTWILRADGSIINGDGAFPETVYVETATAAQLAAFAAFNKRFGGTPQVYSSPPSYNFNQVFSGPNLRDRQYGLASDLSWKLSSDLTMRLIDSYRGWDSAQLAGDTLATSLNLLAVSEFTKSNSQSHELQFNSPKGAFFGGTTGFTSGLYYFHEDYALDTGFNLGPQFCDVIFTSVGRPFLIPACAAKPANTAGFSGFGQGTDSYAAYFQVNYQIVPSLELDVGVRESWDRKTGDFSAVAANPLGIGTIVAPEGPEGLHFSDRKPSVRTSLSWHVTDKIMPFATFATGYKSGGFNSGPTAPALTVATRTFGSETVTDYELGVKSIFLDGKVLLDATFFDTKLNDFQDRSFNGTAFLVRNSGDVRSRGVDVDGQVSVLPSLRFTYGFTYLDSIYLHDTAAPGLEGCPTGGTAACPAVQNLSGDPIGYAPKWHGNAGILWTSQPFMGGYVATFNANQNIISSFLTANTDNPQSRVAGYGTTDLRLGFSPSNDRWRLELFGTNVFDKHYYVSTVAEPLGAFMGVNNPVTGATLFRGFLGDPARYGVRLSAKF